MMVESTAVKTAEGNESISHNLFQKKEKKPYRS
jgi:hypothetical protein